MSQVPTDVPVWRTPLRAPTLLERKVTGYYFRLTEPLGARWQASAEAAVRQLWPEYRWDALLVTCPPFSLLELARRLAARYSMPLVVDMRDGWSQWCLTPWASRFHYWANCWMERRVLRQAAAVLVPTHQVGRDLQRQHGKCLEGRWSFVPNGFDQDLSSSFRPVTVRTKPQVVIGYVGSFYFNPYSHRLIYEPWYRKKPHQFFQYVPRREDWSYRSPLYFFRCLAELFRLEPRRREQITVRIAGRQPDAIRQMADDLGIADRVEWVGFLKKAEIIRFYEGCDYLLSTSVKVEGGEDYCVGGKTYEYFAAAKPILGFVARGAQREVLEGSGLSEIFDPDQTNENAVRLASLLDLPEKIYQPDAAFLSQFDPSVTVRSVAEVLQRSSAGR
jgi:glycosyltransferase involved in cell wall biosynthesis